MPSRSLTKAELEACTKAARKGGSKLDPEDRFDLRQELALRLALGPELVDLNVLFIWAREWAAKLIASRGAERETLRQIHAAGTMSVRTKRTGANWLPRWYAPVAKSRRGLDGSSPNEYTPEPAENAPFACKGARVMHVKAAAHSVDMENLFAEALDNKRHSKK